MMRALFLLSSLAVFSIPFGTRKLIYLFTPGFHEYEAVFVYVNDALLVVFLLAVVYAVIKKIKCQKSDIRNNEKNLKSHLLTIVPERSRRIAIPLVIFLFLAGVSVFFAPSFGLALYSFVRLFTAVAFAVTVAYVLRQGIVQLRHIFGILAASAVFQSLIAFAQFIKQGSVGLRFLGEPALSATAPGIAKFAAEGGKILRAYGTFPHPNVLGAFLVIGLLALLYFYLTPLRHSEAPARSLPAGRQESPRFFPRHCGVRMTLSRSMVVAGIFFVLLGLTLTFSRAAWAIAILASLAVVLWGSAHQPFRRLALPLLFILVASGYTLVAIFSPLIFPRAQISATEPSVVQRLEYNRLGMDLIAEHPFGVGIGNQVIHSVRNGLYEKFGMTEVWQWEPIHDIYILIAAEIGVLGMTAFLLFLLLVISNIKFLMSNLGFGHFIKNWKLGIRNFQNGVTPLDVAIPRIMLFALLLFGLVDHFLWTLRPSQLMLWFAIGLLLYSKHD